MSDQIGRILFEACGAANLGFAKLLHLPATEKISIALVLLFAVLLIQFLLIFLHMLFGAKERLADLPVPQERVVTTLDIVLRNLNMAYKLPEHHEFVFLNANDQALHDDRPANLIYINPKLIPLAKRRRYADICAFVFKVYKQSVSGLARVSIWDNARNMFCGGRTLTKRSPN